MTEEAETKSGRVPQSAQFSELITWCKLSRLTLLLILFTQLR